MKIGLALPNIGPLATKVAMLGAIDQAEELGLDSIWVGDHLAFPPEPRVSYPYSRGRQRNYDSGTPVLDPLVLMSAAAARTERVQIGISVLILPYRHPLISAKMIASMAELSGGRIILGVGIGWLAEEFEALSINYGDRAAMSDEQIAFFRQVWYEETPDFKGTFYNYQQLRFLPRPQAKIPIWIGGNGRPALTRAVRLGDGVNFIDLNADELERTLQELSRLCSDGGRSVNDLDTSMRASFKVKDGPLSESDSLQPLTGTLDAIIDELKRYAELGMDHIILSPRAVWDLDQLIAAVDLIGKEIKPALS